MSVSSGKESEGWRGVLTQMANPVIKLRAIEREDLPILRDWRNGLMEAGTVRQWRYLNLINQEKWLNEITAGNEHLMFAFYAESAILGVVGLTYVDWVRR